ncbi:uncharacterized protein N7482_003826 [Penicillium canariense]|uniref:Uncharacterized protein n=1 Tax=Penicillium canariense TaxID=189055 RepID=A0A9W9I9A2_9EURO|nr:uncharacterized protein N7482_003826 [Penicillium canariense]KAJ5168232.1 hypothetical protein N7482_003826 [Penicillium canariense]
MGTDSALSQSQSCDTTEPPTDESSFRFTPIKALRSLPRLWERKPATPFRTGLKRKLWKRFQSSFSNMQTLESSTSLDHDALETAINASKDAAYARGVKRLCVGAGESASHAESEVPQPGRSFLETKWESEASRKRRKLPDAPFDVYDESLPKALGQPTTGKPTEKDLHYDLDVDGDLAMTTESPILFKAPWSPPKTAVFQATITTENLSSLACDDRAVEQLESAPADQEQCEIIDAGQGGNGNMAATPTKIMRNLTTAQEGTLVRSALRSSLDGEDAELLNDFLSKAKAKRAAKAALVRSQESDAAEKSSSPEALSDAECATPRSRRALEDLDANSPSPVKVQISPSKGDFIPGDESREDTTSKDSQDEEPAPASPACRRSTRVKAPPANAPAVRNTISLRRAKGTEFVFLQRTEAQELSLVTRRNTKHNKGSSMMPKYALQAMAQEDSLTTDSDRPSQGQSQGRSDRKASSNRKATSPSRKSVTWNEERMVAYEGDLPTPASSDADAETDDTSKHDVGRGSSRARSGAKRSEKKPSTSHRSSRQMQQQADGEVGPSAPTSAAAVPASTPKSRRVRRLGDSTMTSGTPMKTGSGRVSKGPVSASSVVPTAAAGPSTPTKPRRKLIPKSPSSSLLSAPVSKANDGSEQPFVSGIPTRSAGGPEGTKRTSMLAASAGCTPMPRRVRART